MCLECCGTIGFCGKIGFGVLQVPAQSWWWSRGTSSTRLGSRFSSSNRSLGGGITVRPPVQERTETANDSTLLHLANFFYVSDSILTLSLTSMWDLSFFSLFLHIREIWSFYNVYVCLYLYIYLKLYKCNLANTFLFSLFHQMWCTI